VPPVTVPCVVALSEPSGVPLPETILPTAKTGEIHVITNNGLEAVTPVFEFVIRQYAFVVPAAEYVKVGVTVDPFVMVHVVPVKVHE